MKTRSFEKLMIFHAESDPAFTIIGFVFAGFKIHGQIFTIVKDYSDCDDRPLYIETDTKGIFKIYRLCVLAAPIIQEVDKKSISRKEFKSVFKSEL